MGMRAAASHRAGVASFVVFLCLLGVAWAMPPLPHEFHGLAVIDGAYAAQGTVIEVLDSSGARCGSFTLKEPGFYGYLSCNGDDPSTAQDEGASPGEDLLFVVDGAVINTTGMRWRSGAFSEVNLLIGPADAGLRLINQPARITADAGSSLWRMLITVAALAGLTASLAWLLAGRKGWRHG